MTIKETCSCNGKHKLDEKGFKNIYTKQEVIDTANYNYDLGYQKALDDVEKHLDEGFYLREIDNDSKIWIEKKLKELRGEK